MVYKIGGKGASGIGPKSIRSDPYMSCNFFIEIGGLVAGGFTEVGGLESEMELESYAEGGVNGYIHYFPKQARYPNLVLSRGLTDVDLLWLWYQTTVSGKVQRKNGTIILLNQKRLPVMWWNFKNAYPVKWVGPQLNANNTSSVAIERMELVHEGIDKPFLSLGLVYG
ncbi:MAG: phage tail protein [Actinomycetota bacterium]